MRGSLQPPASWRWRRPSRRAGAASRCRSVAHSAHTAGPVASGQKCHYRARINQLPAPHSGALTCVVHPASQFKGLVNINFEELPDEDDYPGTLFTNISIRTETNPAGVMNGLNNRHSPKSKNRNHSPSSFQIVGPPGVKLPPIQMSKAEALNDLKLSKRKSSVSPEYKKDERFSRPVEPRNSEYDVGNSPSIR